MTKLEFINQKIELKKNQLQRLEKLKSTSNKYELEINDVLFKNAQEDLQYYEQIKTDLEAWKSIKSYLVVEKRFVNLYEDDFKTIELRNGCIDELESGEDYSNLNKIIKALEVEDE